MFIRIQASFAQCVNARDTHDSEKNVIPVFSGHFRLKLQLYPQIFKILFGSDGV